MDGLEQKLYRQEMAGGEKQRRKSGASVPKFEQKPLALIFLYKYEMGWNQRVRRV
jgi:hypothetical protein